MKSLLVITLLIFITGTIQSCGTSQQKAIVSGKTINDLRVIKSNLQLNTLDSKSTFQKCRAISAGNVLSDVFDLKNSLNDDVQELNGLLAEYQKDCEAVGNLMNKEELNKRLSHLLNTIAIIEFEDDSRSES